MPVHGWLITAALLGGAVLGAVSGVRWSDALAAAVAAAALSVVAPSRRGAMALLTACLACGAVAHGAAGRDRGLRPALAPWFDHAAGAAERLPAPVDIDGTIAVDASIVGDSVRLVVDIARVAGDDAPGRAQLYVAGELAAGHVRDWTAGRRVRAPALLRRPQM